MYRGSRQFHRWVGIVSAVFLVAVALTGFFLANKSRWDWMRPPSMKGGEIASSTEIVSVDAALQSAFALGHPELKTIKDVDRVDYRPKSNIFKVISKEGYREVQVDGATAKVLSSTFRNDQLVEDLHDLSFFGDLTHGYVLPVVALGLVGLGATGIGLFFTPIFRRWKFRRTGSGRTKPPV